MTKKINIRSADPNDYNAIIAIFDSWRPDHWDSDYAKIYYREFFDNRDDCSQDKVFVGVADGRIVGVTGYCPDVYETDDICWLNWFYVHKDLQKRGYGGQLLDHVIEILKANKVRKLYVDTASYRFYRHAQELYENTGFKQEAVLKDYYGKGEHQVIFGMYLNGTV